MQQVQQRELPERISWARAMIFAIGYFLIAVILIGQLPGYIYLQMTASTLQGLEQGALGLGVVCLGGFAIIQVIVLLFDPKPVVPPLIITVLGAVLSVVGLGLSVWATLTGCSKTAPDCNQYFPTNGTNIASLLGGKFLWFQPGAIDFLMLGLAVIGVGLAMVFYGLLASGEMRNPDRRDLGTTPAIRWMLVSAVLLLIVFLVAYTYVSDQGLAARLVPGDAVQGHRIVMLGVGIILGSAVFMALAAFALRLHYLMRPVRKSTMSGLYAVGALGLAQLGAVLILGWLVAYPLVGWMHTWSFIGLGKFLTICARETAVPATCSFSPDAGYLVDAIITMNFFAVLMAAIWAWRSNRNLVVIGSVVVVATIAAATLLIHTSSDKLIIAMMLCIGMLVLAGIWTIVARREFAVVGENNLGCLGQWLVLGTCLFVYLAAFAFFSLPTFPPETEPNVPFVSGLAISAPTPAGQTAVMPAADAIVMLVVLGILAGIQFYFLVRNRYKV